MAVKLFDGSYTAAAIQGLTASHYYWLGSDGTFTDVGGAALVATVAVPMPTAVQAFDVSRFTSVALYCSHGVLTGGVGGKISAAQVIPDLTLTTGAPVVVGASTIDQALAATAESTASLLVNAPVLGSARKLALAVLWTTVPTAATVTRISVWASVMTTATPSSSEG